MIAHRLLAVAVVYAAVGTVTTLPATASAHQRAGRTALAGSPACVDVSNSRGNGTQMYLWQCQDNNTDQKFVIDNGQLKVKDTLS
ncbi:hypothetical protein AB0D67_29775 [Streptosporangium sp. NPDC048047]|uniref:hypothetical protein n=1 Tax=Streptosporangium sp. NPDC048047 TaxID=3155748 RepID=UPI0034195D08